MGGGRWVGGRSPGASPPTPSSGVTRVWAQVRSGDRRRGWYWGFGVGPTSVALGRYQTETRVPSGTHGGRRGRNHGFLGALQKTSLRVGSGREWNCGWTGSQGFWARSGIWSPCLLRPVQSPPRPVSLWGWRCLSCPPARKVSDHPGGLGRGVTVAPRLRTWTFPVPVCRLSSSCRGGKGESCRSGKVGGPSSVLS